MGVTYDTGALLAGERNDRAMWALHKGILAEDVVPVVPATVLAQAWRGGRRQQNLVRLLKACRIDELDDEAARRAGTLLGRAGGADVVDASVVDGAIRRGDGIVTSDRNDILHLAQAGGRPRIRIDVI